MKKLFNKYFIIGIGFLFAFLLLIVLLNFNVKEFGDNNSEVGLAFLNKKFVPNKTNETWNDISDLILYFSILILFIFVVKGLLSLFDTGSIFKVEKDILVLGFLIVIIGIVWIGFDKILIINYRPFYEHEGSFPSTHVLLVVFMSLYSFLYVKRNDEFKGYVIPVGIVGGISSLIVFIGRIKSGNHFFTDCLGGIILALALFFIGYGILKFFDKEPKIEKSSEE